MSNEQSSYRSIIKSTSIFGGVQLIQILITLLKVKFLAVFLGPTGLGISNLYISTFNMISSFGEVLKLSTYPIIVDPYQIKSKNYQLSLQGSYFPLAENMKSQLSVSNRFILPDKGRVKKNNQQKYNLNNLTKLTFQNTLSEMTLLPSQLGQPDNSKVDESSTSFLPNQGLSKTKIRSIKHILKSFNPSLSMFKNSTNCLSLSYCQVSKWFISSQ
jgi:hypothetical protein